MTPGAIQVCGRLFFFQAFRGHLNGFRTDSSWAAVYHNKMEATDVYLEGEYR
jgi:hypothetical protein